MNNYTVVRAFTDKETGKQYEVGSSYEAQSQERIQTLESGGYIAAASSQQAQSAQMEQKAAQANAEKMAQAHQAAAQNVEPKTVINGKVVPLKAAQAAEAYFETTNTQTGVQAHHDNSSEAVPAGQIAQQAQMNQQQMNQATGAQVRQAEVQSSQAHLEEALNAAPTASGANSGASEMYNAQSASQNEYAKSLRVAQETNAGTSQAQQQAAQAAAMRAEQTNAAAAEAEEAALNSKAAAKARAKKENQ